MKSKYKVYQEYKSLSFPFLDKLPSSWNIVPLYALSNFRQGKLHEPYIDENGKFICINARFVSTEGKKFKHCNINLSPVKKLDILMVMSDLPNGRALAKALYVTGDNNYALNQRVCAITATKIYPKFLYYQLNRNDYFLSFDDGSNQTNLSNYDFKKYPVLLPSKQEQQTIANYLDIATVKIDTLIEKQTKLIELLKEKRQAVISTAVTRGLDNTVAMKDSGVEWLGEIPEHWTNIAINKISPVKRGASPRPIDDPKYFDKDGEYAWVRIADVSKANGYLNTTLQQLSTLGSTLSVKMQPGELFVSIAGTVGKPCITNIKACIHDGFVYFPQLPSKYIQLLYRIFEAGECYGGLGKMGTQLNLNTETIGGIHIAIAPDDELIQILSYIDEKTTKIDKLISKSTKAIDLLKEKRTALISSTVTGKIDVREALL